MWNSEYFYEFFIPQSTFRNSGGLAPGKILLDKPSFCGMKGWKSHFQGGMADENEIPFLGLG
jgi:hypothetical protein